jgi:hypothetical protein
MIYAVLVVLAVFATSALVLVAVVTLAPKTPPHLRNRPPYRYPTCPPEANRDA